MSLANGSPAMHSPEQNNSLSIRSTERCEALPGNRPRQPRWQSSQHQAIKSINPSAAHKGSDGSIPTQRGTADRRPKTFIGPCRQPETRMANLADSSRSGSVKAGLRNRLFKINHCKGCSTANKSRSQGYDGFRSVPTKAGLRRIRVQAEAMMVVPDRALALPKTRLHRIRYKPRLPRWLQIGLG